MRSRTSPAAPSRRPAAGPVVAALCALLIGILGVAAPAAARRGQEPGPTTTAFALDTTTPPSTAATTATSDASSGATTPGTSVRRAPQVADTTQIDRENRRFTMVIVGLLAVAVALALLTIRYWRVTKPGRRRGKGDDPADLEDLDEDALFVAAPNAVDDLDQDDGYDDDVVEYDDEPVARRRGRRSRRAVAGADHADTDDDWEPMATGEQDRVSGQVPRATSRPSAGQRARALGVTESEH